MSRLGKEIIKGLRELADAAHKGDLSKFKTSIVRRPRKKKK